MPDKTQLYDDAWRAALLGLAVNLALGVVKLIAGVAGNSFALIADSVNSLGDVVTSGVVMFALWWAQRPADKEHPYGHSRAEAIAASHVALLLILSAVGLAWEAIQRLPTAQELPAGWTLWIAAANAVIKEALYRYKIRVGQRTGSQAIIAHAWDHRSDALCSLAVLVGLAAVHWGGQAWIAADEVASLAVAAAIFWSAGSVFLGSVREQMDLQADEEMVAGVRAAAAGVEGVLDVEKLRVRKSGIEYLVEIHVEVDSQLSVAEGHRIGHHVKDAIIARFGQVRDVLVHLEPHLPLHAGAGTMASD
jgi:cation diffusion facilitator family transporter